MAGFRDVFARKELKYRMRRRRKEAFCKLLAERMMPDEYGLTRITSIYYDTPDHLLALRSYDKPLYKEKLRLRMYGNPAEDERVFVEVKKKLKGIVYKRRIGMSRAAARAYLAGIPYAQACRDHPLSDEIANAACTTAHSLQIAREIDAFVQRYGTLDPAFAVVCTRESLTERPPETYGSATSALSETACTLTDAAAPTGLTGLRVTFDTDLSWRDLTEPDAAPHALLASDEVVVEVKTAGALPLWFVEILDAVDARPTSYSKYGEAFHARMMEAAHPCTLTPTLNGEPHAR